MTATLSKKATLPELDVESCARCTSQTSSQSYDQLGNTAKMNNCYEVVEPLGDFTNWQLKMLKLQNVK